MPDIFLTAEVFPVGDIQITRIGVDEEITFVVGAIRDICNLLKDALFNLFFKCIQIISRTDHPVVRPKVSDVTEFAMVLTGKARTFPGI